MEEVPVVDGGDEVPVRILVCEPYANGQGWWHVPFCVHINWSDW
jgi:hypothetical protein